jgi:nitrate reductase gamma subunit
MMTLRRYLVAQYDFTGISSKILLSKSWEIAALLITGLLVLALVALYHIYEVDVYKEMPLGDFLSTGMGLGHMFDTIIYFTVAVYVLPLVIMLANTYRMYRFTMCAKGDPRPPLRLYLAQLWTIIDHMVTHKNIGKCVQSAHKPRWIKHWWLGFGFVLISVILIFFLKWFQTDEIYPLYHPQRWLGYLATLGLAVGSIDILIGRMRKQKEIHKASEFSDWILPVLLLATAVSGIAVHIFRYMDMPLLCHYTYAVHLAIATPMLVIELPFGKLAHAVYRPMALYFQAVRERALAEERVPTQPISKEAVIA